MHLADGFGNYLYIIFAVVYVVYTIIKAGKKVTQNKPTIDKRPQSSPTVRPPVASPEPQHNPGDELKKMLEDLLGGGAQEDVPQPEVLRPQPTVVYEKPKPVKASVPVPRKEKPVAPQMKSAAAPAFRAHPEVVQKGFIEPVQEEEMAIDFDIRQAIIYSEILKRPQY